MQWEGKESPHKPTGSTVSTPTLFRSYWLLLTELSFTPLQISTTTYREDCGKKFPLLRPGLPLISFFRGFWFRQPHDTSVACKIMFSSRRDTRYLATPAPITWPASCPPHLHILFTPGACIHAHTNTQQLPEVLKSYRFFTQCWIMYSELKKNYIHYDRISEHEVGVNSCQAQETI